MKPIRIQKTILYSASAAREEHSVCGLARLDARDVGRLHEVWPVDLEEMRSRLKRGDHCWTVERAGQLVHYSWVQFSGEHWIASAARRVQVSPGTAWIYHCRTAEEARGQGLYPDVLMAIRSRYGETVDHYLIYTEEENRSSQRGIEKAGFRKRAVLLTVWMGRRFGIPLSKVRRAGR